jgi:hypothetical protein
MTTMAMNKAAREAIAQRVLADPVVQAQNLDGGLAAADFIRNAAVRNRRTAAQRDASFRAAALAVLDGIAEVR